MSRCVIAGVPKQELLRILCAEIDAVKEMYGGPFVDIWKVVGKGKVSPELAIEILVTDLPTLTQHL